MTRPATARAAVAADMSERRLQTFVVSFAMALGYETPYHTHNSRRSAAGFPDLVMIRLPRPGRPGRLVFAEIKSEAGEISAAQTAWLTNLRSVGAAAYLWRPSDWLDHSIQAALR